LWGFQIVYGVANGYIVSVTNASLGQTTTFTRDPTSQHITRIVDPLNRTTDLRYDANKNVDLITRYKDPPANTQPVIHAFTYDPTFHLLTQYKDPLNQAEPGQHVWTYGLDGAKKNIVSITNPLNKTWTIARLATGEPQQITDPLGHTTTFGYDTYGHLASVCLGGALGGALGTAGPWGPVANYDNVFRRVAVVGRPLSTMLYWPSGHREFGPPDPSLVRRAIWQSTPRAKAASMTTHQRAHAFPVVSRTVVRSYAFQF
jgi:YD repeat-containing protein